MQSDGKQAAFDVVVKHSLTIAGHRTSVSLERTFWEALKLVASDRGVSLATLVADIDAQRGEANLSSAIRIFVLTSVRSLEAAES